MPGALSARPDTVVRWAPAPRFWATRARAWSTRIWRIARAATAMKWPRSLKVVLLRASFIHASCSSSVGWTAAPAD